MTLTSAGFIAFLCILIVLYYGPLKRFQWQTLLVGNYIFYLFSGVGNLFYIVFTTITTYFITRKMTAFSAETSSYVKAHKGDMSREEKKAYKEARKKVLFRWLLLDILLNIGLLAVVKYTNFTISNINAILSLTGSDTVLSFWDIALPMGISFYIFMSVGYAIDVYRGKYEAEENIARLACFISFFPQLIQGPISRFDDLQACLFAHHDFSWDTIKSGLTRVLWGFFKKLVIADRILIAVKTIIGDTDTYYGGFVFLGMVLYAVELYCDFTGGIDITIGVAEMLGLSLKENFIRPYFSKNLKEFWNRWHITMGTWFTDYIFYPLSVSKGMLHLSHVSREKLGDKLGKRVTVYLSAFIVWFATGIWHGASWNFIVWGLLNYVVLMVSQELIPFYRWFHSKYAVEGTFCWRAFQIIRTCFIVALLRTFDCYRDVPLTFKMVGTMFTQFNISTVVELFPSLGLTAYDYGVVIVGTLIVFAVSMKSRATSFRSQLFAKGYWTQFVCILALFVATLIWGIYGVGFDSSQFIYNQF